MFQQEQDEQVDFERVSDSIRSVVQSLFGPNVRFFEIEVQGERAPDGFPFLNIVVVYDAGGKRLDTEVLLQLVGHLRPELAKHDEHRFPVVFFRTREEHAEIEREERAEAA